MQINVNNVNKYQYFKDRGLMNIINTIHIKPIIVIYIDPL